MAWSKATWPRSRGMSESLGGALAGDDGGRSLVPRFIRGGRRIGDVNHRREGSPCLF